MRYRPMEEQLGDVEPVVDVVPYNKNYQHALQQRVTNTEIIFEYPTVYVIYDQAGKTGARFKVYVGETNDIVQRTQQHLTEPASREDWQVLNASKDAEMMVIGDRYFNKSLTLDIENRLMLYLLSVERVSQLTNRRTNPQNKYFMSEYLDTIFADVWRALRQKRPEIFPEQRQLENSAIYKASPFHALTLEQQQSKAKILARAERAIADWQGTKQDEATLIFIAGQAGTGKTVLLSTVFYELARQNPQKAYLLVNHDQQVTVYQTIAKKLGLTRVNPKVVSKPTTFIKAHQNGPKVDVVLVDEAHLLWTQGKQSYQGHNQLNDLRQIAKVVIIVYDCYQILRTSEYLDNSAIRALEDEAAQHDNRIELINQERMAANVETIRWIHELATQQRVTPMPADANYQLQVAQSPKQMAAYIKKLDSHRQPGTPSLARILATFDWKFVAGSKPKGEPYWNVQVGDWRLPWNLQLPVSKATAKRNQDLAWAEQSQTIDEVGSTFTIQGFDLNYAAVIIGPSAKYRDGKVIFDPSASKNRNVTNKRTWHGKKISVATELLRNELNVLLTRGVHGLILYAVDEQLQQALLTAAGREHILGGTEE